MTKSFLKAKSFQLKAGFTLIELLVVIAIIGILSSVVLASLNSARTKARDTRRVSDLKQVQVALELYYDANSKYPQSLDILVGSANGASLPVLPKDPSGVVLNAAGGYKYAVNNSTTATMYHLGAALEQTGSQTTLEESDVDVNSAAATPAWYTDTVDPKDSVPFDGADMVYDLSNTKF